MIILSHRGYWKVPTEKNTPEAFTRSFCLGFGTETDVRDLAGNLVISHDPPNGNELTLQQFFLIYRRENPLLPLALNIKADGLQKSLFTLLEESGVENYFLFDMSIPDALVALRAGLKCFTRQSEYEPKPAFFEQAEGVWIDGFHSEWWDGSLIERHLAAGKKICLVSPELHGREHLGYWEAMSRWAFIDHPSLMMCTDFPETALSIFGGHRTI